MNKVLNFFKRIKHPLIWTVFYIFTMWAILYWMFNFNMFSTEYWIHLARSELHGFPGFVFGLLILSALPLYVATTVIIARRNAPLFTIKIPKFIEPVPCDAPQTDKNNDTPAPTEKIPEQNHAPEFPPNMPHEMRTMYTRAKNNLATLPRSGFDISNITSAPLAQPTAPELQPVGQIPLPNDFDIPMESDSDFDTMMPEFNPVFSEINFDDTPIPSINDNNNGNSVTKYLTEQGIAYTTQDDIILTDKNAIAVHDDANFWVADEETWFTTGGQRPSPIKTLVTVAAANNVQPILYMGQTNIMDFETHRQEWEKSGIRVITSIDEIK